MTDQEARIARIAMDLGFNCALNGTTKVRTVQENFIKMFEPNRPCRYDWQCLLTSRCPNDPVCGN